MAAAGHAEASRWFHYGLTSNDVVDTAQALQIRQACRILLDELERLRDVLKRRALEFRHTVQIGRTHGVHAEPITFGLKLAIWYEEAGRNLERAGGGRRRSARRQDLGRGRHLRAHRTGSRRADLRAPGSEARARRLAGDPARPPRATWSPRWRW